MYILVDPHSSAPLYLQVKQQMHLAVATGALRPGDQLPAVRDLAARLRVNPNTIARVYRELAAEGLLNSRQGSGTFVAPEASPVGVSEGMRVLRQRLGETVALGRSLGLSADDMRQLAEEAWLRAGSAGRDDEVSRNE